MFCEKELVTALKGLKNNKAPVADSVVNEFLTYDGSEVRNTLLKIMSMIFEKGKVPSDFRRTLIKPLYKKGDKSECGNYRGISLVSVGSKSVGRDAVEKSFRRRTMMF